MINQHMKHNYPLWFISVKYKLSLNIPKTNAMVVEFHKRKQTWASSHSGHQGRDHQERSDLQILEDHYFWQLQMECQC